MLYVKPNWLFVLRYVDSLRYVKRPGSSLDIGCIIAKLELDDPTKLQLVCFFSH